MLLIWTIFIWERKRETEWEGERSRLWLWTGAGVSSWVEALVQRSCQSKSPSHKRSGNGDDSNEILRMTDSHWIGLHCLCHHPSDHSRWHFLVGKSLQQKLYDLLHPLFVECISFWKPWLVALINQKRKKKWFCWKRYIWNEKKKNKTFLPSILFSPSSFGFLCLSWKRTTKPKRKSIIILRTKPRTKQKEETVLLCFSFLLFPSERKQTK